MKNKLNYWRYLGLSKETLISFRDRVAYDNLKVIFVESTAVGLLCFATSLIMVLTRQDSVKPVALVATAFVNFVISFFAGEIRRNGAKRMHESVNRLISVFRLIMFAMAIFVGIYNIDEYAALLVGIIVLTQVSFDVLPVDNIVATLTACTIYISLACLFKSGEIVYYDSLNILSVAILGGIISWHKARVKYEHEEYVELIERSSSQMFRASLTDSLTGLLNRRNGFDKLETLTAQSSVSGREMVCMILDLDDFKAFNDTYGHVEGDKLLENVGRLLSGIQVKYSIFFSRTEGEEFMGFWMPSRHDEARAIAEEICEKVRSIEHPLRKEGKYSTISIGIYQGVASVSDNASSIYSKADNAVYDAKRNGRDRIEFYDISIEK